MAKAPSHAIERAHRRTRDISASPQANAAACFPNASAHGSLATAERRKALALSATATRIQPRCHCTHRVRWQSYCTRARRDDASRSPNSTGASRRRTSERCVDCGAAAAESSGSSLTARQLNSTSSALPRRARLTWLQGATAAPGDRKRRALRRKLISAGFAASAQEERAAFSPPRAPRAAARGHALLAACTTRASNG